MTSAGDGARYVVMLSAGMDSAVNLLRARQCGTVVVAVTVDYGQRAAAREVAQARELCADAAVEHLVVELPWLRRRQGSGALVDEGAQLPEFTPDELEDAGAESARAVWVPNRNGLLAAIGACLAEAGGAHQVVLGLNREEAVAFTDNSREFLEASNAALALSTLSGVRLTSFTIDMNKKEIFLAGEALGLNWEHIWSCYRGGPKMCGRCESCARLRRAAKEADADLGRLFEEG
ncbi:MAG: 7-cyano-7-deazaguanine synthase QueC [Candidatus Geothermincolia bacterium]